MRKRAVNRDHNSRPYIKTHDGQVMRVSDHRFSSGTSFIDQEEPVKENYNKSRRIHRGLFMSNNGTGINADLNGAYQILKKAFPVTWDRGCALHPVVVNMA